jgi:hypothetical protein
LPHLFGGPCTAHLWHARPLVRKYFRQRQRNEALLQSNMRAHDTGGPRRRRCRVASTSAELGCTARAGRPPLEPPPIGAYVRELLVAAGRDPAVDVGMLRPKPGVGRPRGTRRGKLKKLILRPREFLEDAKHPTLRRLARLFGF